MCRISKTVGCILEVLTLLLTPILKYIGISNARCHICHICHIWHIRHIWHVCCYDNHHMFVCQYRCQKKRYDLRSAANYLRYPTKLFLGPTTKISCFWIFQNFLCIFFESRGSTSWPPRNMKFSLLLIIPYRNGIRLSAN